jgi:hypothetical protein
VFEERVAFAAGRLRFISWFTLSLVAMRAVCAEFDPVSVGIMVASIVVWIIAPYIANKGVFSFAIFFLAIIMVASTAALFMLQRLTDPTTLVVGAVGLVAIAASAIGLPVSPSALALQAVSQLLLATGFFTPEQAHSPETVATVLVVVATAAICCIGLFAVFYIPATEERLQSFSFVIRFGTLFIAPLAGSSPDAMLVCGCAPLALQLAGMVVALFIAIEYLARQLAAAVLWLVSVLCCPCIRCTQCCYRCCYSDSGTEGEHEELELELEGDHAAPGGALAHAVAPPDSPRADRGGGRGRSSSTTRARRRPARAVMSSQQAELAGAEHTAQALSDLKADLDEQPEMFAGHVTDETAARLGHFALTGEDVLAEEYHAFDRDVAKGRMSVGYLRRHDISEAELDEAMAREETAAMRRRRNPGSFHTRSKEPEIPLRRRNLGYL